MHGGEGGGGGGSKLDEKPSILTKCILFDRYAFIHNHKEGPVIPKATVYTIALDVELIKGYCKIKNRLHVPIFCFLVSYVGI